VWRKWLHVVLMHAPLSFVWKCTSYVLDNAIIITTIIACINVHFDLPCKWHYHSFLQEHPLTPFFWTVANLPSSTLWLTFKQTRTSYLIIAKSCLSN